MLRTRTSRTTRSARTASSVGISKVFGVIHISCAFICYLSQKLILVEIESVIKISRIISQQQKGKYCINNHELYLVSFLG